MDLSKTEWLRAARVALLRGGVASVRVEPLARELGVTKGSFYWHFADRAELLEALIQEWEAEADLLIGALGAPRSDGLRGLLDQLARNVIASERGEVPSDAAVFGWAAVSPEIAERVKAAEEERISLLGELIGDRTRGELAYMAYLGFILRRRHSEDPAKAFGQIADFFVSLAEQSASVSSNASAKAPH
ncbi:MAG TPA: helix-turn-helix domain-containing protein [Chloroflexota bacterium]|nr:helix-turn-helix domain-containing protein [Chloroflexota bacterium]